MSRSTRPRYLCKKKEGEEYCKGVLRSIMISHNDSGLIDRSYLRYCDICHTVYLLVPKKMELERYEIPLLEYMGLAQMEALNV